MSRMTGNWTARAIAAVAGGLLLRGNPLVGALVGVLLWVFVLESRVPAAAKDASDDPYAVLGVNPQASDAEIELAWRRAVAAAHPDRLVNADAQTRADGERRMHQLNAARRRIHSLRRNR
ncbi:MAG: J domain-containing protein [Proteobacteria bacterium]|nr:J domain-containing protein [Pseudomonadota bacterium]